MATALARLALLEGRREAAASLWEAVQTYRAANKRLPPRLAQAFEAPLRQLSPMVGQSEGDCPSAFDALRSLVAEEFERLR